MNIYTFKSLGMLGQMYLGGEEVEMNGTDFYRVEDVSRERQDVAALRAELANSVPRSRHDAMNIEINEAAEKRKEIVAKATAEIERLEAALSAAKAENERLNSNFERRDHHILVPEAKNELIDQQAHQLRKLRAERDALAERVKGCEWIPVTERLPEGMTRVLVFELDAETPIGGSHAVAGFHEKYGFSCAYRMDGPITHWMPLPSPPSATQSALAGEKKL